MAVPAAMGMAATFIPWVDSPGVGYVTGLRAGGWITLELFAAVLALALVGDRETKPPKGVQVVNIVLGAIAYVISVWDLFRFNHIFGEGRHVEPGMGVFALMASSMFIVILTMLMWEPAA